MLKILRYLNFVDAKFVNDVYTVYKRESLHYPRWVKTEADLQEYIELLKKNWQEVKQLMPQKEGRPEAEARNQVKSGVE